MTSEDEIPAAVGAGSDRLAIVGVSITLSAGFASLERSVELLVGARTILTFDKLLQFVFHGGSGVFDELSLECVVRVILGWIEEEVPDFRVELWTEGADDIVEAGLLDLDSTRGKLHFYLCDPHFWISGLKRW